MVDKDIKSPRPLSPAQWRSEALAFALIVVGGILVLFLRNPDPIIHPALFGEDASWMSYLLSDRLTAYLHSRPDYLVLGQTMMLDLALQASLIATGGTLALLPQAIAMISYVFWASIAGLGYLAFAGWMSVPWRLAVSAGILLLPIGQHMNEVVGRVLNLGYLFLPLAFLLCLLREGRPGKIVEALLMAGLVVCLFTNPIVAAIVAAHLGLRLLRRFFYREPLPWTGDIFLGFAWLAFTALFLARLGEGPVSPGNVLVVERLVEMVGARSVLFPFVFPWYEWLNDGIVLAALTAVALLVLIAMIVAPARQRWLGLCLLAATLGSIAVTVLTRPFLSGILDSYGTTFPGRYYMAQNVFAFMTVVWALSCLPRIAQSGVAFLVLALVLPGAGRLFEFGRPQMVIATNGDFFNQVARALQRDQTAEGDTLLLVDAYPDGWSIAMPTSLAQATSASASLARSWDEPARIDIEALPWQWGLRSPENVPVAASSLGDRLRTAGLNDLSVRNGIYRSTGADPYIVLDLTGVALPEEASLFSFNFTCENRTRFVEMQLFWATQDEPYVSEDRSLTFRAGPGHNIVPLDSHPTWPASPQLSALRIDIVGPRACSGYVFGELAFGTRRPGS